MTDIGVTTYHLSQVDVVAQCGCNADLQQGVEVVDDNVFVTAVGQRLQLFHVDSQQRTLLPSLSSSTIVIRCLRASNGHRFLAVAFSSGADQPPLCLVYDAQMPMKWSAKPRRITIPVSDKAGLWCSVLEFSNNNKLLLCQLNEPDNTLLVMDWQLNELRHTVPMNSQALHASFDPEDASRYCTCGEAMLQVWRLGKRIQQIPAKGLSDPNAEFTRHCWFGVSKLLVGGACGSLWVLQNCEQSQAFPQAHRSARVVAILKRDSMAYSLAADGSVCQFDLAVVSRNTRSGTAVELLRQFRLEHQSIRHAVWLQHSPMVLNVAVKLSTGVVEYNLGEDTVAVPIPMPTSDGPSRANSSVQESCEADPTTAAQLQHVLKPESTLVSFHEQALSDLSTCVAQPLLLSQTFSAAESRPTLRLWRCDTQEVQAKLPVASAHDFSDRTPLALHSSGRVVLVGDVDRILQYTVTLDGWCVTDEFVIKGTIRSFSGESYVNSVSPSILRFSNGGHLFAVVVGKTALVLPFFQGSNRKRSVYMILSGQSQDLVDVQFSARDNRIWTLSKDGSLYQWDIGQVGRSGEFLDKRITPCFLSIGPFDTPLLVAVHHDGSPKQQARKRTLQSVGRFIVNFGLPSSRTTTSTKPAAGAAVAAAALMSTTSPAPSPPRALFPSTHMPPVVAGHSLLVWKDGLSAHGTEVYFSSAISAIASSRDHPSAQTLASAGFVVMGFVDGKVIVTTWPLQLVSFTTTHSDSEGDNSSRATFTLDPRAMKVLNLHNGVVRAVALDYDAQHCYTGGDDAALFTIQLYEDAYAEAGSDSATVITPNSDLAVVLRASVNDAAKVIYDLQEKLVEQEREFGGSLKMEQSQQEDQHRGFEAKLGREIKRRDDIISQLRERIQAMERSHQSAVQELEAKHSSEISKLGYEFEARLQEQRTRSGAAKQAFEEFLTSFRDESEEAQSAMEKRSQEQQEQMNAERRALEQERESLLQYVDYMREVYDSTITQLDEQHDKEIVMLRGTLKGKDDTLNAIINTKRKELNLLRRHIVNLKSELVNRDNVFLDTRDQLRRSADQIENLQQCLKQALHEVTAKAELSQHWESKAGEQSRKITELERVRKALTSQLDELRADMVPKDAKIAELSKKLAEVDTEYERQLKVLSSKDKDMTFKKTQATQLQRQLRGLRKQVQRREAILKHVATRCTQLGTGGEPVDWQQEVQALARVLQPYLHTNAADDSIDEQVFEQFERHNQQLRESIQQMQHTIASVLLSSQAATQSKIEDNKILLEEVNRQRKENKELTRLIQQGLCRPVTSYSQASSKSPSRAASRRQRLPSHSTSVELLPSPLPQSRGTTRVKLMGAHQIPQASPLHHEEHEDGMSLSISTSRSSKLFEQPSVR